MAQTTVLLLLSRVSLWPTPYITLAQLVFAFISAPFLLVTMTISTDRVTCGRNAILVCTNL